MGKTKILHITCILLVAMALLFSSACSKKATSESQEPGYNDMVTGGSEGPTSEEEFTDQAPMSPPTSNRKIIQNKAIVMETLEFDKITEQVEHLVDQYLGYVESSEVTGTAINRSSAYNTRYANYTIRIPSERLISFVDELKTIGNVIQEQAYKEDVTNQYVDLKARIHSLEVQEKRLLELLEKGTALKDILEIENQLSSVRYEIETKNAHLINLENLVSYGTVKLEIREVIQISTTEEPARTLGEKLSKGFLNSIKNVKNFFINFFIFLVVALPYLFVIGIIAGIILFIISKIRIRKIKRANLVYTKQNQENKKKDTNSIK